MTQLERELDSKLQFHAAYAGVHLNNGELTEEEVDKLNEQGCLVLSTNDTIEVEDRETGELYVGKVTITKDDYFLFDVYDEKDHVIHEEEVPLYVYLNQLRECGALDAYPSVELE